VCSILLPRRTECAQQLWNWEWNSVWCYMWRIVIYLNSWYLERWRSSLSLDKLNVMVIILQATKFLRGVNVKLYSFFKLGPRWGWVVNDIRFTFEKSTHCTGSWMELKALLEGCIIRLSGIPNSTESLYRLRNPGSRSVDRIINFSLWLISKDIGNSRKNKIYKIHYI